MSELRIRSEPPADAAFIEDWRPRSAEAPPDDGDDTPFMPLLLALEEALGAAFGCATSVHPGRGLAPGAPDVAPELAALLATVRLGGNAVRPVAILTGVTTARHAGELAELVARQAQRLWPASSRRAELVVDVIAKPGGDAAVASIVGSIRLLAPPTPVPATAPRPLGAAALEVPLRLVVRLAEEAVPLACLLPLQPGLIIPINACPEMPVHLGDHLVGWASLTPLPDGRQQANIITIDLKPAGERA
jgi:flagellar motor switch/type III secretory pathway protein FliN